MHRPICGKAIKPGTSFPNLSATFSRSRVIRLTHAICPSLGCFFVGIVASWQQLAVTVVLLQHETCVNGDVATVDEGNCTAMMLIRNPPLGVAFAHEILDSAIDADHANVRILVKDGSAFDDPAVDASSINYASLPDVELATLESEALFIVRVQVPYSEIGIMGPRWVTTLNLYGQSVMRKE